jgi:Trypsin
LSTEIDCQSHDFGTPICVGPAQEIKDFATLKHPKYNPQLVHFDIALIKLKTPANLEQENIGTVCLPFSFSEIPAKNLAVMGWGNTISKTPSKSNVLLETKLPLFEKEKCKKELRLKKLINSQFCAGAEPWKTDTCKGIY